MCVRQIIFMMIHMTHTQIIKLMDFSFKILNNALRIINKKVLTELFLMGLKIAK